MKKINVDGLLALKPEEIKFIFFHCKGDTVAQAAKKVPMAASSAYKMLREDIYPMLHVDGWEDIKSELCKPLRAMVYKSEDLDNWPEGFREKIEALREPTQAQEQAESNAESSPTTPQSQETTGSEQRAARNQEERRPRPAWPLLAIPLLLLFTACIFALWFAWNNIPGIFLGPDGNAPSAQPPVGSTSGVGATNTVEAAVTPSLPARTLVPAPSSSETVQAIPPPSPIATRTSIPLLFRDTFDTGVNEEWGMAGDNFNVVDGRLSSLGPLFGVLGDSSWIDYAIEFKIDHLKWSRFGSGLRIFIRRQDNSNYMAVEIVTVTRCYFRWLIVLDGTEKVIVDSKIEISRDWTQCQGAWRIEADGNHYRVFKDFEQRLEFIDDRFANGGTGILINGDDTEWRLDDFAVIPLP
jgi:hypothetical protein